MRVWRSLIRLYHFLSLLRHQMDLRTISRLGLLALLLPGWVSIPLHSQERPNRPQKETRREHREPSPAGEESSRPSPDRSGQLNDIQESWMKELRNGPAPSSGKDEGSKDEKGADTPDQSAPVGTPEAPANPGEPAPGMFGGEQAPSFIGLLLRFVLIAGLMGGTLYIFVRYVKKRTGIVNVHNGPVEVLASVPLMPGKFLQIVDLAGQLLVLGVSESGVHLVHVVESSTTAERLRLWHESRPKASASSLMDVIQNAVKKGEFRFWGGERSKERPDFLEMLNGEKTADRDISTDRLSELLREQNRKIRRTTENPPEKT